MKAVSPISPSTAEIPREAPGIKAQQHVSFKEVLAGVDAAMHESSDIYRSIQQFQSSVIAGREISPKELLVFQMRASQFGVHVELLSKVAESSLSSLRRLQQTQ